MKENIIFTHIKKTAGTSLIKALDLSNFNKIKSRSTTRFFLETLNNQPFIWSGHRPYGFHKRTLHKVKYITMLAPPIERCISDYFFAKQCKSDNYQHPIWEETNKYSIIECLEKGIIGDNTLVRFISGNLTKKLHTYDLKKAKNNLKNKYAVFGLKTDFELSCKNISNFMQVDYSITKKYKQTKKEALSNENYTQLMKFHALDIEFYKYACELFYKNL